MKFLYENLGQTVGKKFWFVPFLLTSLFYFYVTELFMDRTLRYYFLVRSFRDLGENGRRAVQGKG